MVQRKEMSTKSTGDLAVDGLLQGLGAGAIMLALLVAAGMLDGATPATVLARFGLPGSASPVTGVLGHLAVSAMLGLVWGVLYGGLLHRLPLPAWLLGIGYGLALYAGAALFVVPATGLAEFPAWELLAAHMMYGVTLGWLSGRSRTGE